MKKCINCGREIPDDAVFCGFCGTHQPETENKEEEEKKTAEELKSESSEVKEDTDPAGSVTSGKGKEDDDSASAAESDLTDNGNEKSSDSEVENVSETEVVKIPEQEETDDSDIRDAEIVESTEEGKNPDVKDAGGDQPDTDHETEESSESVSEETVTSDQPEHSEESDSEIKDAEIVEPSGAEQKSKETESVESDQKSDHSEKSEPEKKQSEEDVSGHQKEETSEKPKKKKPHLQMKKIDLSKFNVSKEDFSVLLDIIQNPVERHGIDNATTWVILIFAWIANWIAFRSFSAGFFSLLIVLIGMIFLNWLTLKDHATFGETVRNSAEVIFTPSLLVFVGGLFIRNVTAGAEVFAFHSIFSTAFIGLFFLTAALILFLLIVIKRYEMKIWQIVLILTIFTSLLIWYLMTSGAIALFA